MESLGDKKFIDLGIETVQKRLRGAHLQTILTNVVGRALAVSVVALLLLRIFNLLDAEKISQDVMAIVRITFLYFESFALLLFTLPFMAFFILSLSDGRAIILAARAFFSIDLFNNIKPPAPITISEIYGTVSENPLEVFLAMFSNLYSYRPEFEAERRATVLMIAFLFLILALIAFIFKSDMRSAATIFACIQFIVLYAQTNLLFARSLKFTPTRNFGELFSSDVVIIALLSYLFLEIALQTSYIDEILNPVQKRQSRVLKALDRLKAFQLGITRAREDVSAKEKEEDKSTPASMSRGTLSKKYSAAGANYFIQKTSDSLFSRPGGRQEKLTGRLQRYHKNLLYSDQRVDEKLVGASVVVSPFSTLLYVAISVIFRIVIMIGGLYVILNPDIILFVLRYPPTIYNSLEIREPEGIVLLLVPIVILILLLTTVIGKIQERFSETVEERVKTEEDFLEEEEEEQRGVIVEGELSPIEEDEAFYEELAEELEESTSRPMGMDTN